MAIVSLATLKNYFNTGDVPSDANFIDLVDTLCGLDAPKTSILIGGAVTASVGSVVIGDNARAYNSQNSLVIGKDAYSYGSQQSIAIGRGAIVRYAEKSIAFGAYSSIGLYSQHSIAIGYGATIAPACAYSMAIGYNANCSGTESIAIGFGATVDNGSNSVAIGYNSFVDQYQSVAIGQLARALAPYSVAIGSGAEAIGPNPAVVIGQGLSSTGGIKIGTSPTNYIEIVSFLPSPGATVPDYFLVLITPGGNFNLPLEKV